MFDGRRCRRRAISSFDDSDKVTNAIDGLLACAVVDGHNGLSFQAGYERYDDSVYRDSSARGLFGLVRLKVVAF